MINSTEMVLRAAGAKPLAVVQGRVRVSPASPASPVSLKQIVREELAPSVEVKGPEMGLGLGLGLMREVGII